jgi:hypothetical protein
MKRFYLLSFILVLGFNGLYSQVISPKPKNQASELNKIKQTQSTQSAEIKADKQKKKENEAPPGPLQDKIEERKLIVKLTDADMSLIPKALNMQEMKLFGIAHLDIAVQNYPIKNIKQLYPHTQKSPKTAKRTEITKIFEIEYESDIPIMYLIKELRKSKLFEYVEASYIRELHASPNDTRLSEQILYFNQISAPDAWDIHKCQDGDEIVIGICDSGTEWYHEDLVANLWMNLGEDANGNGTVLVWDAGLGRYVFDPGDLNGIDDDGNGKVDDLVGWNFWTWDGTLARDPNGSSNNSHGTHVAGCAAAVTNNGKGVASVSWNVKFLPTKHSSNSSGNLVFNSYSGIAYLTDMGVDIINCSWGGLGFSFAEKDVIDYALDEGVVIFASAGNNYTDQIQYPSGYPGVVNIASVNRYDTKTDYSNYGVSVDVTAPGGDNMTFFSILSTIPPNIYSNKTGTSMASPIAAGAFALLKSYRNTWTNEQLIKQFLGSGDDISTENPDYSNMLGSGRINVENSLTATDVDITDQLRLHLISYVVNDEDIDGIPEYSESCELQFVVQNFNPLYGSTELNFVLSCDDPDITITNGSGSLAIGKDDLAQDNSLTFSISDDIETKEVTFKLKFASPDGILIGDEFFLKLLIIGKDANQIIIGYGESATEEFPMNRYYNYSVSEFIYLSSEMGDAVTISSIGFLKDNGDDTGNIDKVKIYFKHTTNSTLSDGNYSLSGFTKVFDGAFENLFESGWMSVQLDNFFQYNGTSNLQVLIIKDYQDYTSDYPEWGYYETAQSRLRYNYDDDILPSYLYSNAYMPMVRFGLNTEFSKYVYIGNGLISYIGMPLNRYYNYNVTESIYYQFEIGPEETFTALHFNKGLGEDTEPIEDVRIYIKHTTDATLPQGEYSLNGYTKVFDGDIPNEILSGWITVPFISDFEYNGTDNLQILVIKGYQEWIGLDFAPLWRISTVSQNRCRYNYDDNEMPTVLEQSTMLPNIRLSKKVVIVPPTVSTSNISDITDETAVCGGEVTDDGFGEITARGVCWSKNQNPTIADNITNDGSGLGSFTSDLTGLDAETTYFVRSYATNYAGTAYGEQKSFTTEEEVVYIPVPESWGFTNFTGNNATVVLPKDITPKIGNRVFLKGDAIGYFYKRDNQLVCAGYSVWHYANLAITVWGDDSETAIKDGFAVDELYEVKIWDGQLGKEYNTNITYSTGNNYYTVNGYSIIGSLEVLLTSTQAISLATGWNLISSNIEPLESNIEDVFGAIADNIVLVKNNQGQIYYPLFEINDIGDWNKTEGYQVYTSNSTTLEVLGFQIKPEETPINLGAGWSIVGYLRSSSQNIEAAMKSLTDDEALIIAKNNLGQIYYPLFGINDINDMLPGQGYQIYLIKASTLQYQAN